MVKDSSPLTAVCSFLPVTSVEIEGVAVREIADMFFQQRKDLAPGKRPPVTKKLAELVRQHMDGADDDDVRIVSAIAGLLAGVAYADRTYAPEERTRIRSDLSRVQGLPDAGVEAVCQLLDREIVELGTGNSQRHTRDLRELIDVELRRELLDVLVDLAAADGEISLSESDLLRRTASAMGLSPEDYNASQARHGDRISLLK